MTRRSGLIIRNDAIVCARGITRPHHTQPQVPDDWSSATTEWPGDAILVTVGIRADVLAPHNEPDVVGLVQVVLDTQDRAVQRFRLGQILGGISRF
jgi:hypothetical protein